MKIVVPISSAALGARHTLKTLKPHIKCEFTYKILCQIQAVAGTDLK
jgi:hypothetical protein